MIVKTMGGKMSYKSMTKILQNIVTFFIVLITIACIMAKDMSEGSSDSQHTRQKRTVRGQQSSQGSQIPSSLESYTQFNWIQYTPTTPSPENVNCYVEVPETRLVGGTCVNLGRNTGCQAGVYLAFTEECQNNHNSRGRSRGMWSRATLRTFRMRRRQARLRRRFGPFSQRTNE